MLDAKTMNNYRFYRSRMFSPVKALVSARTDTVNRYTSTFYEPINYGKPSKPTRYFEEKEVPFRFVGYCDELAKSIRHTGHYEDEFQDSKLRGVVFRLGHGKGLIAGYQESDNDGYVLDLSYTWDNDDEAGAAHAANQFAERTAEKSREYNEAFQAKQKWDDLTEQQIELQGEVENLLRLVSKIQTQVLLVPEHETIAAQLAEDAKGKQRELERIAKKAECLWDTWQTHEGWNG
jgi:hypothetical protein